MEFDLWSKTLLKSYGMLEKISGALDRTFNKIAFTSRNTCTNDTLLSSTYQISDKLLSLLDRKANLINTKVLIDEVLDVMDEQNSKILILKYMNNLTNDEITRVMNISIRTVLRRSIKAIEEFSAELVSRGYNDAIFKSMYKDETWIFDIYRDVKSENEMFIKRTEDFYHNNKER